MKRQLTKSNVFEVETVEELKLSAADVLSVLLKGWILYPILLFWPAPFIVIEVWEYLGFPENLHTAAFVFAIVYLLVLCWILADRYEEQGLPEGYKKMLKQQEHNETALSGRLSPVPKKFYFDDVLSMNKIAVL